MEHSYRFLGESKIANHQGQSVINLAPSALSDPVYFTGALKPNLAYRQLLTVFHNVITLNYRKYTRKSSSEIKIRLNDRETRMLTEVLWQESNVEKERLRIQKILLSLKKDTSSVIRPYFKARDRYINYILQTRQESWLSGLPYVTVSKHGVILEGLSRDESVYSRVNFTNAAFQSIGEAACGCTAFDYSIGLGKDISKIRHYRNSIFSIDSNAFSVDQENDGFHDKKLDIPKNWMRSFLLFNSGLTSTNIDFKLQAMDLHNICSFLSRNKAKNGSCALRIELDPGKPVAIVFEPWKKRLLCPRSIYTGKSPKRVSIHNRRSLLLLEPLLSIVDEFEFRFCSTTRSLFISANAGPINILLGFSGWQVDKRVYRGFSEFEIATDEASALLVTRVLKKLKQEQSVNVAYVAKKMHVSLEQARVALDNCIKMGCALYDPEEGLFILRELAPLPYRVEVLQFRNKQEQKAMSFINSGKVEIDNISHQDDYFHIMGSVREKIICYQPDLILDQDQQIVNGSCYCHHYKRYKLNRGLCEHMIAVHIEFDKKMRNSSQEVLASSTQAP